MGEGGGKLASVEKKGVSVETCYSNKENVFNVTPSNTCKLMIHIHQKEGVTKILVHQNLRYKTT